MPTADLDAVLRVLPVWLRIGTWTLMPLLLMLAGWLAIWVFARCTRVVGDGLHWTEFARQRFAARLLLAGQVGASTGIAAALSVEIGGELTVGWKSARVLLVGLLVLLASRGIVYRHGFRTHLGWSRRDFLQNTLLVVALLPGPAIAVAMAIDGPVVDTIGAWGCGVFYAVGLVLVALAILCGPIHFARWLGCVEPADDRLRSLVAAVEQRTGHSVRACWILRTRSANAFAMPWRNELGVTSGALEHLTDAELTAVLMHEFGHLRESGRSRLMRLGSVSPLLVLAVLQPVVSAFGGIGMGVLSVAALLLAGRIKRRLHGLELAADGHAHSHLGAAEVGDYARALEHLHRLGLIPAVLRGEHRSHPDLYDRMLAAGVVPDYPRPLPPPRRPAMLLVLLVLNMVMNLGVVIPPMLVRAHVYESETAAAFVVMLNFEGDDGASLGALGYHWVAERPRDAAILLAYVAAGSRAPEYPAWLAMALSGSDESAARAALEQAETLAAAGDVEPWQQEAVAAAREWLIQAAPSESK
jgi:Zn-dependent protease with chaperone function